MSFVFRPLTEEETLDLILAALPKPVMLEVQAVYGLPPCCSNEFAQGSGNLCTHPVLEPGRSCFACMLLAYFRRAQPELTYSERLICSSRFIKQAIEIYGIKLVDPREWFADWDSKWGFRTT